MAASASEPRCERCGSPAEGGWPHRNKPFCEECWKCAFCGGWLHEVGSGQEGAGLQSCRRCRRTAAELSAAEAESLLAIDRLRPGWVVWKDSGAKNASPPIEQPAEVAAGVLLGDLDNAKDVALLQRRGAGAVLCLCPEHVGADNLAERLQAAGIRYKEIAARDAYDYDIVAEVLPQACDYIEEELQKGHRVLVNCWAGKNRSASVVVGFLALRRGMPVAEAAAAASRARGTVLENRHFRRLLVKAALGGELRRRRPAAGLSDLRALCCERRRQGAAGELRCKRRRTGAGEGAPLAAARVLRVAGAVGHVVHGLCFELEGGRRTGTFLNNDQSQMDLGDTAALAERGAEWVELAEGEFIAEVTGHRSWIPFLAAELVLHLSSGRTVAFRGPRTHFERNCRAPFSFAARPGHAVVEVLFDCSRGTCVGVHDCPLPQDLAQAAAVLPPPRATAPAAAATAGRAGRVRRIAGGVGHVVHGFCLELEGGERRGIFLEDRRREDGSREEVLLDDSEALERRGAQWQDLAVGECIVEASGHRSWRGYLAADVVLRTSAGRRFAFRGPQRLFERWCGAPFRHVAQPGHEIAELLFDLSSSTCSGIRELPLAGGL